MDSKNGMILWVMGGAGVFLLWSGITNRMDLGKNLASYVNGEKPPAPAGKSSDTYSDGSPKPDGPGEFTGGVGGYFGPGNEAPLSTHIGQDVSGTYYVYDQNMNIVEQVPDAYQDNPNAYVPGRVVAWGSGMQ